MGRPHIKRIHVNQHAIRRNQKTGRSEPPLRVKAAGRNIPGDEITIDGPSRVVYRPDRPLSCGARVWIETLAPVTVACKLEDSVTIG